MTDLGGTVINDLPSIKIYYRCHIDDPKAGSDISICLMRVRNRSYQVKLEQG